MSLSIVLEPISFQMLQDCWEADGLLVAHAERLGKVAEYGTFANCICEVHRHFECIIEHVLKWVVLGGKFREELTVARRDDKFIDVLEQ